MFLQPQRISDEMMAPVTLSSVSPRRDGLRAAVRQPLKRAFDMAGAALLLMMVSPALALIALMVKLEDGGPVFYAHRRIGRGGSSFGCLKFRSMRIDGDRVLAEILATNPGARAEWEATQKLRNDPRVTRIGRLLRSTSLDEVPQLLNVLRGEMSLVGPRPVVQKELDGFYGPAAAHYGQVRPGITGLWQVSGRSDTSYDTRVALDVAYVSQPSLRKDMAILARTALVVIQRRGAC